VRPPPGSGDRWPAHELAGAGLVAPATLAAAGTRVPAVLTDAGRDVLSSGRTGAGGPVSEPTHAEVVRGLRAWTKEHDLHVRAAVELLVEHDVWLHRDEFRQTCLERTSEGGWWIAWYSAREAFDAGGLRCASSTEVAVLEFAIALGTDRFRFSRMGAASTRLLMDAVASALGVTR
jgi:hypothetical protein